MQGIIFTLVSLPNLLKYVLENSCILVTFMLFWTFLLTLITLQSMIYNGAEPELHIGTNPLKKPLLDKEL